MLPGAAFSFHIILHFMKDIPFLSRIIILYNYGIKWEDKNGAKSYMSG